LPEIELGIILKSYDRTEGAIDQLATQCGSLQSAIVGLGTEMAKGGTAGREAMTAYRDLNRELSASDKAGTLAVKAWKDQNEVLVQAIDVGDRVAKTFDRGLKMLNQYNVGAIRVTQAEEAQTAAAGRLETARAALADIMAKEPENAEAIAKAQDAVTKAQDDLTKATKGTSDAQGTMNMMLIGFALQAPAFAKDIQRISESTIKLGSDLMSSATFGPIFSGQMSLMTAAIKAFNWVMDQNPVVLILGAIAVAVAALYLIWDTNFLGMRDSIQAFWDGTVAPVVNAMMDLFKTLWDDVLVPLGEIFVKVFSAVIGPVVKFVWDTMIGPAVTLIIGGLKFIIDTIAGVIRWIHDLIDSWTNWNPAPKTLETNYLTGGPPIGPPGLIPGGQVGFPYGVPHTGLYRLHQGEVVERAGSSRVSIGTVNVYANDYPGGRAAGKGFLDELRSMGVYPW
jgi:hypothetical protein